MSGGELILYTADDGSIAIQLRALDGTVWLSQLEMAALFDTTKQNIAKHLKAVFAEGELAEHSVVNQWLTTATDGKKYRVAHYNLDAILAVGYRVRSPRGTQFRQWATTHLREYLVKGFVLDDTRLKEPGGWDYFDELLARIRDIRASEKRFYQKIRDIYTTAVDYDGKSEAAQLFFKKVQNKMLWAVTGHTAPELIAGRADPALPNMGLTTWQGGRVRKQDVTVAKNYLSREEIGALDRIVVMYLDYAEDQAQRRRTLTMRDWEDKLDAFLQFNEREVLTHAGKLRADVAEKLALERYESFDAARREAARLAADAADMATLEQTERRLDGKKREKKK
ncbi:virulence RhuM family protein [Nevskia sp.]|uniref:virulence RhuM family protein n=1 Tax=Nevskia sp. TaxID=1929292 RepID=UPI0025D0643F|nr:virulence RhuM family protein [Nevskia sp.]